MVEFLQECLQWPVLPATILLVLVLLYWLSVIFGALTPDIIDFDLDPDTDFDSPISVGLMPLRFLNIGRVPLMLWVSLFALSMWVLAWVDYSWLAEGWTHDDAAGAARKFGLDLAFSLVAVKLMTQPLRDMFDAPSPHPPQDLIGKTCVISTLEVTPKSGQAQFATNAAPLVLNVRTEEETLVKGDRAEILDYIAEQKIYIVCKAPLEE